MTGNTGTMVETASQGWKHWMSMVEPWVNMSEKFYIMGKGPMKGPSCSISRHWPAALKMPTGMESLKQSVQMGDEINRASEDVFDAGLYCLDRIFKANWELFFVIPSIARIHRA
jgi:hypothetical protein